MARVLLTGATGFVGRHLHPALVAAGHDVISATRNVEKARSENPGPQYRYCDVSDPSSVRRALEGCDSAYYLVHSVAASGDYPVREARAAQAFRDAAAEAGLERLVYLGGVEPRGAASRHLRSRLRCGELLRLGQVPVFELRAGMIIGKGSVSWTMVHDLARRLPAMVLPTWMEKHSWPVAIEDVVYALTAALALPIEQAGVYDVPGPERLSHRETLLRVASHLHKHPVTVGVPLVSPRLSSYWIALVTEVDLSFAKELVEGLRTDLDPQEKSIWSVLDDHRLLNLDESIDNTLIDEPAREAPTLRTRQRLRRLTRSLREA
jgi:uncharacterized protein YbjT (DUF2867 family)